MLFFHISLVINVMPTKLVHHLIVCCNGWCLVASLKTLHVLLEDGYKNISLHNFSQIGSTPLPMVKLPPRLQLEVYLW